MRKAIEIFLLVLLVGLFFSARSRSQQDSGVARVPRTTQQDSPRRAHYYLQGFQHLDTESSGKEMNFGGKPIMMSCTRVGIESNATGGHPYTVPGMICYVVVEIDE